MRCLFVAALTLTASVAMAQGAPRSGNQFRTFVHPVRVIRDLVRAAGFEIRCSSRTPVWEILVCARGDVT